MAKNPRNRGMAKLLALMVAGIVGLASTGLARLCRHGAMLVSW
jgi:hypothetical protein